MYFYKGLLPPKQVPNQHIFHKELSKLPLFYLLVYFHNPFFLHITAASSSVLTPILQNTQE